mmetsp:Transcript_14403/g.33450  ORF Transcript_14403/g.33450 Transcript_14403/m.33450 type:complete len:122 (-) Transcript_14403:94-459(-)
MWLNPPRLPVREREAEPEGERRGEKSSQNTIEFWTCVCVCPPPQDDDYDLELPPGWVQVPSKSDPSQVRYLNLLTYQRVKKRPKRGATTTWITSSGRRINTDQAHPLHVSSPSGKGTDQNI